MSHVAAPTGEMRQPKVLDSGLGVHHKKMNMIQTRPSESHYFFNSLRSYAILSLAIKFLFFTDHIRMYAKEMYVL